MAKCGLVLAMVMVPVYVAAFISGIQAAGTNNAGYPAVEDRSVVSCEVSRGFVEVGCKWAKGEINGRKYVLELAKVVYEGKGPALVMDCEDSVQDALKRETAARTYSYRSVLTKADKVYLRSLSPDLAKEADRPLVFNQCASASIRLESAKRMLYGVERRCLETEDKWTHGEITDREYIRELAKALYEPGSPAREAGTDYLKEEFEREIAVRVFSLKRQLTEADKVYLRSLSPYLARALNMRCEIEKRFDEIDLKLGKRRITDRESVLEKAKAMYEGDASALLAACSDNVQEQLKRVTAWAVQTSLQKRQLTEADKVYLRSLSPDLARELSSNIKRPVWIQGLPPTEPAPRPIQ